MKRSGKELTVETSDDVEFGTVSATTVLADSFISGNSVLSGEGLKIGADGSPSQVALTNAIIKTVEKLLIELVLTAHPIEVTRRSLVHKNVEINKCLSQLEHSDLTEKERKAIERRLLQLIAEAWHTNEIRTKRPTPFEEAK